MFDARRCQTASEGVLGVGATFAQLHAGSHVGEGTMIQQMMFLLDSVRASSVYEYQSYQ